MFCFDCSSTYQIATLASVRSLGERIIEYFFVIKTELIEIQLQ